MDRYTTIGQLAAVSGALKTALSVIANANARGNVYQIIISNENATVGDNLLQWVVDRFTADGTGTAGTTKPIDSGAPAGQLTTKNNYTVEPTIGVRLLDVGVHQRATWTLNIPPGREWLIEATAGHGIAFRTTHGSYTGSANAAAYWEE